VQVNRNPLPTGGVVITVTDITALKEAERGERRARKEATRARRQLVEAIEAINEGFILCDSEDRVVLFNRRYREEFALDPDVLKPGTRFEDLIRAGANRGRHPRGYAPEEFVRERMERHRNPATPFVLQRADGRWELITEYRTSDGGIVGIRTDITGLKQREIELEESRRLLRAVIDAVPGIINVKDRLSRYVLMNRFQGEVYGTDPNAAIGRTSADFTGPEYGEASRQLDLQVIAGGLAQPFQERRFVDRNGVQRTWFTAKMPLKDPDGQVLNVVTVALDITQLKATERARSNLARYFAPSMVDVLAASDEPFGPARSQDVAVLFADIIGFTGLCAVEPAGEVFALLREFHSRLAAEVFACGGTIDKYIGDALMATFGTPDAGPDDAARALACAFAMQRTMDAWSAERHAAGLPSIRVGIGVHYGPVLLGNVGTERRLEFAVIGDTVNVASRLERLTRSLKAGIVASDAVVDAARRMGGEDAAARIARMTWRGGQRIRGRGRDLDVWMLPLEPLPRRRRAEGRAQG
jgi:PAS domain S-box-containing protein